MRYGIIPVVNTNGMKLIDGGYKVHDVSVEGSRITAVHRTDANPEDDIFVLDLAGYSEREYVNILMLRQVGAFTYTTTAGGSRTIPKYEKGEQITKEEYRSVMNGKSRIAPQSSPAERLPDQKPGLKKVEI